LSSRGASTDPDVLADALRAKLYFAAHSHISQTTGRPHFSLRSLSVPSDGVSDSCSTALPAAKMVSIAADEASVATTAAFASVASPRDSLPQLPLTVRAMQASDIDEISLIEALCFEAPWPRSALRAYAKQGSEIRTGALSLVAADAQNHVLGFVYDPTSIFICLSSVIYEFTNTLLALR
jgi:hypothetical protein